MTDDELDTAGHSRDVLFSQTIDAGQFGFVLLGAHGEVLGANRSACTLLAHTEEELNGRELAERVHPDDRGWSEAELGLLLAGDIDRVRQELRFIDRDGDEVWAEVNVRAAVNESHPAVRAVAMLEAVGDRRLRERELQRLADTDPLTELLNRRRFAAEINRHLAWSERYGARGALLVIDLDGLKQINDTHGHRAGDQAIVATARLLSSHMRASDLIARMGGDEFAVLLPAADGDQATAVAHALLEATRNRPIAGDRVSITLSIGIAAVTGSGTDAESLIERADTAMYAVKRSGGNGYATDRSAPAADGESPAAAPSAPESERTARIDLDVTAAADPQPDLETLLATVEELGGASLGLVAWELYTSEQSVAPAWSTAVRNRLLERGRYDASDREWLYELTAAGQSRLRAFEREEALRAARAQQATPPSPEES